MKTNIIAAFGLFAYMMFFPQPTGVAHPQVGKVLTHIGVKQISNQNKQLELSIQNIHHQQTLIKIQNQLKHEIHDTITVKSR